MRFATLNKKYEDVLAKQSELGTPAVGSPAVDSPRVELSLVDLSKTDKEERADRLKKRVVKTKVSPSSP